MKRGFFHAILIWNKLNVYTCNSFIKFSFLYGKFLEYFSFELKYRVIFLFKFRYYKFYMYA